MGGSFANMELSKQKDFFGKKIHIIGMARSGLAAAEVLRALGAITIIHDEKNAPQLEDALDKVRKLGLDARTGEYAYRDIETADAVVASPGVPSTCPGVVKAEEHGLLIMSEVELAYRICPAPIIAVTGTNGKTTTTALVGDILRAAGKQVVVAGNIIAGDIRLPLSRAAFRATRSDVIVAEISSFQLERVSSFRPKVAALLNISADHLDRHSDMAGYAGTKARIFEFQTPEDCAILNADDPGVMEFGPSIKSRIWQFSRKGEVELGTFVKGTEIWSRTPDGEQFVCDTASMKLRGSHNVENIMAGAAIILAFGADAKFVQSPVDAFEALEHRLEPVTVIGGVEFLNNSMCTNMLAAIRSLEAIGKSAIVIAGGKGKGRNNAEVYLPLAEAFKKHAKHVVIIGDDAPLIDEASRKVGFVKISHAYSMEDAVEIAWQHAKSGDTIVLSPGCASFDMFKNFEHRGQVFKAAVKSLAERVGARG